VAEWSKALDLSYDLTPSGENPREFEPRRYQALLYLLLGAIMSAPETH
jgi:hypothetical protein